VGLRSLLGFTPIPQGTYNSVTFTFETASPAPVISYVDLTTTLPSVQSLTGTLTSSTVTVSFPTGKSLMVGANGLAGLHIDFDLRDSLATDANHQITGVINPVVAVQAVSASEDLGEITEFTGNVLSVNTNTNSFVMQGPYGFQKTIDVNSNTQYNGSNSLSTLVADAIVSVIGRMQADGTIKASDVELISTDKAFISGRVLAVNPSSGPVQTVTMWVGEELGTSGVIPVDSVQTIDLSAVSTYDVCFFDNILTQQLFNDSSLVVGQRIFIGGRSAGSEQRDHHRGHGQQSGFLPDAERCADELRRRRTVQCADRRSDALCQHQRLDWTFAGGLSEPALARPGLQEPERREAGSGGGARPRPAVTAIATQTLGGRITAAHFLLRRPTHRA
jgi:hypothetical protein